MTAEPIPVPDRGDEAGDGAGGDAAGDPTEPAWAGAVGGDGGEDGDDDVVVWRALVGEAADRLRAGGFDNAAGEARWLAERAGGFDAAELVLALDRPATVRSATHFHRMLDRRAGGEPLQYVLGRWPFRTVELVVDPRVLIPRPETEVLAGHLLDECDRLGARVVVDLGTGSGALAVTVLAERTGVEVWGTDASDDALELARANLAGLGRRAVPGRLATGSWFAALPDDLRGRVDVVVSNPPYVAAHEMPDLPDDVRDWEPHAALVAGPTGLEDIEAIAAEAPAWLTRPGALLLELAPHQARPAERLARAAGFTAASIWPDLAGRDRILHARR